MALSKRDLKQIKIIVIGVLALLGILWFQFKGKKNEKAEQKADIEKTVEAKDREGAKAIKTSPPLKVKQNTVSGQKKVNQFEREKLLKIQTDSAQSDWGIDPFFPKYARKVLEEQLLQQEQEKQTGEIITIIEKKKEDLPEEQLILSGISKIGNRSFVTINRKLLKTGDEISGYRVKDIQKKGVILEKGNKVFEIKLGK